MSFTLSPSGTVITQTGTDTNLSGLLAISGVTRDLSTHKYTLSGRTLEIVGNLTIDPEVNELIFDNSCPWPHITGKSGGTLQIGVKRTINGKVSYSKGSAITSTRDAGGGPPTFNIDSYGLLRTENNFTFKAYGGVINTPSGFSVSGSNSNTGATGCTLDIEKLELNNTSNLGVRLASLYFLGSNVNIINLIIEYTGTNFAWEVRNDRGFPSPATFILKNANINTDYQSDTSKPFVNNQVANNQSPYSIRPRVWSLGANFYDPWLDTDVGSAVIVDPAATDRKGQGIFKASLKVTSKDIPGANVDANFYLRDTVGSNAFTTAAAPSAIDLSLRNTYVFSAVTGAITQEILLGAYRKLANIAPTLHYRSNSGTNADDYTIYGFKYGKNIYQSPVVAKGVGGVPIGAVFSDDPNITLTESEALAKLSSSLVVSTSGNGSITLTQATTLDELYDAMVAYKTSPIAAQMEFPTIDTFPVRAGGDTLATDMQIIGLELLTAGVKFKKLESTQPIIANGAFTNISIIGDVSQTNPTNLSNTSVLGTLSYNTPSDANISLVNTDISTVQNDGVGIITITRDTASFITDYSDPQINFLDSSITAINITSATIYQTAAQRDTNTNAGATFTSTLPFKLGSAINGVTMSGTVYLRVIVGSITLFSQIDLVLGDNVLDLGTQGQLSAISAKIDTRPTLPEIEASTVLAKEVTVLTRSTQTSVDAIPTNPLLTNDSRLANLDTTISSRLASSAYVAPTNPDLSTLATTAQLTAAKDEINANIDSIPTVTPPTAAEIAIAVESALLNDLDGQALLEAIADQIGNQNIDQIALVAAIRTELERTGGTSQLIKAKVDTLSNADLSAIATTAQLTAARDNINANVDQIPLTDISALATTAQLTSAKGEIITAIGQPQTTTAPTAAENAAAVRINLTTELAKINAANQVLLTDVYVPTPAPSVIVPNPSVSAETTKVYAYTETITNQVLAGIEISFELVLKPSKSERILETTKVTMLTNALGYAEIDLQRDKTYLVTAPRLSLCKKFTPKTGLFDLSTLIQRIVPF